MIWGYWIFTFHTRIPRLSLLLCVRNIKPAMAPIATSNLATEVSDTGRLLALTAQYHDRLTFFLNGTRVVLEDIDPEITLLEYLRGIGLTGTKLLVGPAAPRHPHLSITILTCHHLVAAEKAAAEPVPWL